MYISNPDINTVYPLDEISVPVLVIYARDTPLANYEIVRSMAERIPGANLVTIENGGHPLLGHDKKIKSKIYESWNKLKQAATAEFQIMSNCNDEKQ